MFAELFSVRLITLMCLIAVRNSISRSARSLPKLTPTILQYAVSPHTFIYIAFYFLLPKRASVSLRSDVPYDIC